MIIDHINKGEYFKYGDIICMRIFNSPHFNAVIVKSHKYNVGDLVKFEQEKLVLCDVAMVEMTIQKSDTVKRNSKRKSV